MKLPNLRTLSKTNQKIIKGIKILASPQNFYFYRKNLYVHHKISFSQEGEDLIIKRFFEYEHQNKGFYVDIGAHHPQRFSNTYLFYLQGWRGINIDAMPGSMTLFEKIRPKDINIEAAISDSSEMLTYYMFNEPALNSFSEQIAASKNKKSYEIIDRRLIQTQKLSDVLDNYLPRDQNIDFLNIDVEGLDYKVLLSNNWLKYRPKLILIEELSTSLNTLSQQSQTFCFLSEQGYELFAKTFNTSFYRLTSVG